MNDFNPSLPAPSVASDYCVEVLRDELKRAIYLKDSAAQRLSQVQEQIRLHNLELESATKAYEKECNRTTAFREAIHVLLHSQQK